MHRVSGVTNEQAQGETREIFTNLEKRGPVINMFRVLGHAPEILKTLIPFYSAVMGKGELPQKTKEYVYLRTSMGNSCDYCLSHHIASSRKAGITDDQMRALQSDGSRSSLFDEADRAAIRFAEQVARDASGVDNAQFAELKKHFNERQIVELTAVAAIASFTNRVNNALHIPLDQGVSPKL